MTHQTLLVLSAACPALHRDSSLSGRSCIFVSTVFCCLLALNLLLGKKDEASRTQDQTTGCQSRPVPSQMAHKAGREVLFLLHSRGTEGSKVSIHMCRAEAELSRHMQALGDSLLPGIWDM